MYEIVYDESVLWSAASQPSVHVFGTVVLCIMFVVQFWHRHSIIEIAVQIVNTVTGIPKSFTKK